MRMCIYIHVYACMCLWCYGMWHTMFDNVCVCNIKCLPGKDNKDIVHICTFFANQVDENHIFNVSIK